MGKYKNVRIRTETHAMLEEYRKSLSESAQRNVTVAEAVATALYGATKGVQRVEERALSFVGFHGMATAATAYATAVGSLKKGDGPVTIWFSDDRRKVEIREGTDGPPLAALDLHALIHGKETRRLFEMLCGNRPPVAEGIRERMQDEKVERDLRRAFAGSQQAEAEA